MFLPRFYEFPSVIPWYHSKRSVCSSSPYHEIPGIWLLLFHCYCCFLMMNHATPFMTSYNACPDERFDVFVIERVFGFLDFWIFCLDTSGASAIIPSQLFLLRIAWTCYQSHSFYTLHIGRAFCFLLSVWTGYNFGCNHVETELGCFCLFLHFYCREFSGNGM